MWQERIFSGMVNAPDSHGTSGICQIFRHSGQIVEHFMTQRRILAMALSLFLTCGPTFADDTELTADEEGSAASAIATWAEGDHRSEANRARNQYRHPVDTLLFLGLEPDMTVVELWPGGGGWYTEIIAPYVRGEGAFYAAGFDRETEVEYFKRANKAYAGKLAARPDLYDHVRVTELAPPKKLDIAPAGTADMVVTFRNLHNWMGRGQAEAVMEAAYRALKPGGILGLVEHRGNAETPQDPAAKSGYVNEDYAIKLAEGAGFKLVAKSEINANPKDDADHPAGVWTLPPSLRLGEKDRAAYEAIGESDRMTLKFMKPAE
jgi:predicted methyltransferase